MIREVAVLAPTAEKRDPSSGEEERCPWPTCVHRQITPALSERSRKRSRQLEAWIPKQWCYRHAWHTRLKKQPMFLVVCAKRTVRRLIARKLLRPSRGLRCPLIPIWEIVRYLVATSGHSAKEQERLIQLFYESLLIVHGKPPRRDFEIQR